MSETVLSERMKAMNLTDTVVGAAVGVSARTVGNWRAGATKPNIMQGLALAKLLDMDADDLFPPTSPEDV